MAKGPIPMSATACYIALERGSIHAEGCGYFLACEVMHMQTTCRSIFSASDRQLLRPHQHPLPTCHLSNTRPSNQEQTAGPVTRPLGRSGGVVAGLHVEVGSCLARRQREFANLRPTATAPLRKLQTAWLLRPGFAWRKERVGHLGHRCHRLLGGWRGRESNEGRGRGGRGGRDGPQHIRRQGRTAAARTPLNSPFPGIHIHSRS